MHSPSHSPRSFGGKEWRLTKERVFSVGDNIAQILAEERGLGNVVTLSDPFLFPEMRTAIERIETAVQQKETIGIFGDYDADGITGTALVVHALRRRSIEPIVYLPDRAEEGYGLRMESVQTLREKGVTLLITVDTGITAHAEIAHATAIGMDVIVTDHHHPRDERPPARAVLHPTVPSVFPNQYLCGAGVALMLVRALERDKRWEGVDRDMALAAIGTIGDVMPLVNENRTLVQHGLAALARLHNAHPLATLASRANVRGRVTSDDVAFRIVPRINAAGRMAHPEIALQALLEGGDAIDQLQELNNKRQSLVASLAADILASLDPSACVHVVHNDRLTPGIVGLIAGTITERTGKPSFAGTTQGDDITASLRSVPGIDIRACLAHDAVRPYLLRFGGHAQAAGCTLKAVDLPHVRAGLLSAVREQTGGVELIPSIDIVGEIAGTIDTRLVQSLQILAPFGAGNPDPLFLLRKTAINDIEAVGANGAHLRCRINGMAGIGFGLAHHIEKLRAHTVVDIACRLGINTWQGRAQAQVLIHDIRVAE